MYLLIRISHFDIHLLETIKFINYTRLNYKINLDIMIELNVQQMIEFVENYRTNW